MLEQAAQNLLNTLNDLLYLIYDDETRMAAWREEVEAVEEKMTTLKTILDQQ